ncbi:MAG: prepilin-type N-terminal cleavage/methylation domain-containing protein [Cyanobacteria bacterium P01_F01_bin.13]
MANNNNSSKIWLYRWLLQRRQRQDSGFTLTEVLISVVIAGIVVTGLLTLVVELLRVDRREIALERVQRDMQRAIDYVADDLKEAVYVYSTPDTDIVDKIPALKTELGTDALPVLAFWRTEPIEDSLLPTTCGATDDVCQVAKTRRATYSLVVYYQDPVEAADPWKGESVLRRFELPKYDNVSTFSVTPGYADPVDDEDTNFETWTPDGTVNISGKTSVLVDYVHRIATPASPTKPGEVAVNCRNLISSLNSPLTGETDVSATQYDYELAPTGVTSTTGFFACIRHPELSGGLRADQDVYLFLKGNAESANEFLRPASDSSRLPVLQTQVKLGGVIDRDGE